MDKSFGSTFISYNLAVNLILRKAGAKIMVLVFGSSFCILISVWTMLNISSHYVIYTDRLPEFLNYAARNLDINNPNETTWAKEPPGYAYSFSLDNLSPTINNFVKIKGSLCYKEGINETLSRDLSKCICNEKFAGADCGVPTSVWGIPQNQQNYTLRSKSRRVIMGMVVLHELDMTEIRCRMLQDVVDIFIIAESNITTSGNAKELLFHKAFQEGFLQEIQHKILYIFQDHLPAGYAEDGWLADSYLRTFMSQTALSRIEGLRDDDIFLSFDADEIPKKQVVQFLRLYDGFPEPFWFNMRSSIYGYFWQILNNGEPAFFSEYIGSTVGFLRNNCHGDVILIRRRKWDQCDGLNSTNIVSNHFKAGTMGDFAAHHCSWCFPPEGIRLKMVSMNLADGPKYGQMPEKQDLGYIQSLIDNGKWFSENVNHMRRSSEQDTLDYAPEFVLENREKYRHLLLPPKNKSESGTSP